MRPSNPPDPYLPVYGRGGQPQGEPAPAAPRPPRDAKSSTVLWRLTLAQCLLGSGGLLVVLGTFLPWYSVTFTLFLQQQVTNITGWDIPTGKATLILGMAALVFLALQVLRARLPDALVEREVMLYVAAGVEAFVFGLLYLLDGPRIITTGGFYTSAPGIGLYIALIGAATLATGGYLRQRERKSWLL
mgnify:CR=1 FL=1